MDLAPATELPGTFPDLRHVPLGEIAALPPGVLGQAVERMLPRESAEPVTVAAFNSSI